jgi:predicted nucleic acid-binding protein
MQPLNIIVDANIVFSGILNTNGKIGDLLINSNEYFHFIAPEFLRIEIRKHHHKLVTLSKLTSAKVQDAEFHVCKDIVFISEEQINESELIESKKLVADVDPNDFLYIAYSKHFKCKLWSGDGKLSKGIKKKGYKDILTTEELFDLRETLKRN